LCKELNPKFPFTYQFSDEEFAKLYQSEKMTGRLADCFAFLAIFISCLGLLGLAMFTAEQKTKEIGIRKVLGASIPSLFVLLSREFLVFVIIAVLIASPIAWYAMEQWLEEYAYKINISWWMFVIAGFAALAIALLTVSFQAIRAAIANPATSLRSE
jgi:ABC-type antimicrobial peptide transport system permease subunit